MIIPDGMMNTGIFGRGHLERVLSAFLEHYHRARPHQGLEQQLPRPPAEARPVAGGELVRDDPSEASSTSTAGPPDEVTLGCNRTGVDRDTR